jgi:hypothetical protein
MPTAPDATGAAFADPADGKKGDMTTLDAIHRNAKAASRLACGYPTLVGRGTAWRTPYAACLPRLGQLDGAQPLRRSTIGLDLAQAAVSRGAVRSLEET